jgi:hypothetical protein
MPYGVPPVPAIASIKRMDCTRIAAPQVCILFVDNCL